MFDEENDVQTSTEEMSEDDFDGLFSEEDLEDGTGLEEEAGVQETAADPQQEEGTQEQSGAQQAAEMVTLRYRGADVQVPKEEMIPLAQMGMDYKKVREERDMLRTGPAGQAMQVMQQLAQASGMPLEQYMQRVQEQVQRENVQRQAGNVELPESVVLQLTELQQLKAQIRQNEQQQQTRRAEVAKFEALLTEYPELAGGSGLPEEVLARMDNGETPLEAYRWYENKRMKEQIAAREAAEKNKNAAPGSANGYNGIEKVDPWAAGFDSEY